MIRACKKSRWVTAQNFETETIFFSASRDFTPYFHFRCVARATFDSNLIHSADVCFLVMANTALLSISLLYFIVSMCGKYHRME